MASIKQRGGSYTIIVSMGRDGNGKKITKSTTYTPDPTLSPKKQEKALQAFAAEFEKQCLEGKVFDSSITLNRFIDRWIAEYGEIELEPGTLDKYTHMIDGLIRPALGNMKLVDIRIIDVRTFLTGLTKDGVRKDSKSGGYAKGTIRRISNILSSIMRTAVEWEVIERNPCENAKIKVDDSADKIKFFTPEQTALFMQYIEQPYVIRTKGHSRVDDTGKAYTVADYALHRELPEQIKVMFLLAIYSGMRKGEIVGLSWDDVNFENDTVIVKRSIAVVDGKQIAKAPKTKNSYRMISIPHSLSVRLHELQEAQKKQKAEMGSSWNGENWVFIQSDGKQMSYYTPYATLQDVLNRYNEDKAEGEKLPMIPFHGLRHTNATILIASNENIKAVSARLGHAETSTTMNIYAHALIQTDKAVANRMEKVLAGQACS